MIKVLNSVAKHMKIDFEEITSEIAHRGEKGNAREEVFMNYMRQFIPRRFDMAKGEIIASNAEHSRQVDCIIYDALYTPILIDNQSTKIIPIENVYITIEIKSVLNKNSLRECVENIKSVRDLKKEPTSKQYSKVIGLVFAYSSDSLESLLKHLKEYNSGLSSDQMINAICVLDKGLIVHVNTKDLNSVCLIPTDMTVPIIAHNAEDSSLLLFYLLIMECLNSVIVSPPNLIEYARKAELYKIKLQTKIEDLPDNSFYDGWSINGVKKLHGMQDKLVKFKYQIATKEELLNFLVDCIPIYIEIYGRISSMEICGVSVNATEINALMHGLYGGSILDIVYSAYLEIGELGMVVYN